MAIIFILFIVKTFTNTLYPIYPRINLNSTSEEPGTHPVFHLILIINIFTLVIIC